MPALRARAGLLAGTALLSSLGLATAAAAQDDETQLTEIVVTAQKRAQNLQDVPISITALNEEALQANRVVSVTDLSGLAPNVIVRPAAGGSNIPSFTVRGAVSYGVVPGSDKQVSIYLDGVYISSPRGSIFDLPDVQRIEMLRGPQGTLFGRNATGGAVSISTRDPAGEFRVRQEFTVGNYNQFRSRTSVDLPAVGPFSAYGTYVHNYKRGDIRNLGAGQAWDRSLSPSGIGRQTSPTYLGTKDSDSWFAAVKFEPTDNFSTVYKFDQSTDQGTPEGTAPIGINAAALPGATGALLAATIANQPTPVVFYSDAKRPKAVNNSWSVPIDQKVYGHSLTSEWRLNENLSLKNIAAYRKTHLFVASQIDGLGGLINVVPALGPVGAPFGLIVTQPESLSMQWSDELQLNYDSKRLTLTAGALWFKSKDRAGGPLGMQNTYSFRVFPGGVLPLGGVGISYNWAKSLAVYTQAEFHVTPQLDIVGGYRITKDKKSGRFITGTSPNFTTLPFEYEKTRPSYLLGVNYKPTDDILVFGKFSTAFVSGGSVAGVPFEPETAESWEAGVKADFLNRRLRANFSLFRVTYQHLQTAQSGTNFGFPLVGTFVLDQGGPVKAKGFELETTAVATKSITVGGSLGYTDTKFYDVNPRLVAQSGGYYVPTLRPKWTGNLWGQYESEPLFDEARLYVRADAGWRSKQHIDSNPNRNVPAFASLKYSPASWLVNARAALRGFQIGPADAEVAIWGRNLTNNRAVTFGLVNGGFQSSANFQPARTYGMDLILNF